MMEYRTKGTLSGLHTANFRLVTLESTFSLPQIRNWASGWVRDKKLWLAQIKKSYLSCKNWFSTLQKCIPSLSVLGYLLGRCSMMVRNWRLWWKLQNSLRDRGRNIWVVHMRLGKIAISRHSAQCRWNWCFRKGKDSVRSDYNCHKIIKFGAFCCRSSAV